MRDLNTTLFNTRVKAKKIVVAKMYGCKKVHNDMNTIYRATGQVALFLEYRCMA